MRIAFDIRGIDGKRGGKGIWTTNVLRAMIQHNHGDEIHLYTNNQEKRCWPKGVVCHYVKGKGPIWHYRLYQQLLKDKIDAFIATESYILPYIHNPNKIKVGTVIHDLVAFKSPAKHQQKATLIEWLTLKQAVKKSKWIFTVSKYTKKDLIQKYKRLNLDKKTKVIYAGVRNIFKQNNDPNKIVDVQRRYNLNPDYIMMAGTLEPRKNIEGAIHAYHMLSHKNQNKYRFVIAGKKGWYYKEIFKKVRKLNLEKNIKFLEYVPDQDLVPLMQGAKAFLFPSFYEGFGLPILEAMKCGVPVLASRVTSIPELGVDAIHYAHPNDPIDIADGLNQLLENEDYCGQLIQKGLQQVKNFSWDKTAELMLEKIKEDLSTKINVNNIQILRTKAKQLMSH